jgi:phage-related protein
VLIRGGLLRDSTSLRTKLDALRAELFGNRPATLYLDTDRYLRLCEIEDLKLPVDATDWDRIANGIEIAFRTPDPFFYATSGSTDAWTVTGTAQTRAITGGGTAYSLPVVSLTVGGSGAITLAATLTNQTTGEICTLAGAVTGGDVIVIDCLMQTVKVGATDKIALFDGVFPRLDVGADTFKIDYTSGTITSIAMAWNARSY